MEDTEKPAENGIYDEGEGSKLLEPALGVRLKRFSSFMRAIGFRKDKSNGVKRKKLKKVTSLTITKQEQRSLFREGGWSNSGVESFEPQQMGILKKSTSRSKLTASLARKMSFRKMGKVKSDSTLQYKPTSSQSMARESLNTAVQEVDPVRGTTPPEDKVEEVVVVSSQDVMVSEEVTPSKDEIVSSKNMIMVSKEEIPSKDIMPSEDVVMVSEEAVPSQDVMPPEDVVMVSEEAVTSKDVVPAEDLVMVSEEAVTSKDVVPAEDLVMVPKEAITFKDVLPSEDLVKVSEKVIPSKKVEFLEDVIVFSGEVTPSKNVMLSNDVMLSEDVVMVSENIAPSKDVVMVFEDVVPSKDVVMVSENIVALKRVIPSSGDVVTVREVLLKDMLFTSEDILMSPKDTCVSSADPESVVQWESSPTVEGGGGAHCRLSQLEPGVDLAARAGSLERGAVEDVYGPVEQVSQLTHAQVVSNLRAAWMSSLNHEDTSPTNTGDLVDSLPSTSKAVVFVTPSESPTSSNNSSRDTFYSPEPEMAEVKPEKVATPISNGEDLMAEARARLSLSLGVATATAALNQVVGDKREHLYKILVIGELGTGKTSIIKRYVHQFFSQHYRATIGVDFALKVLNWDANTIIRLQLWDIAGQERFGNMTRVYYKEAVGAFIVFDVTRAATFDAVLKWKQDLDSKVQLPDGSPIPCVLLANKCDQQKEGIVNQPAKMDEYCKERGFSAWFETSAKENINIEEAAKALVTKILQNDQGKIQSDSVKDGEKFNLDGNNAPDDRTRSKCSC